MNPFDTVKDSSIHYYSGDYSAVNSLDGLIRIGTIQRVYNDETTGELRYLVEAESHSDKIPINCVMLRRFGGIFNYEDYIYHGYSINDKPDPVSTSLAKAGDRVLVGQLNGQGREGVILGGLTHPARETTIQATSGPQYDAEFNGVHTSINVNGEWTLTFKGQPTNLAILNNIPSGVIPDPTYDTAVGTSFIKFDKTGSWTVSDNATSDLQSIFIDKPNGMTTVTSGQISLVLTKSAQSVVLTCKDSTINSSNSITENTTTYNIMCQDLTTGASSSITEMTSSYTLMASTSAKIVSPKVAIGFGPVELLMQLNLLITALGLVTPIPLTPLAATPEWPAVVEIQTLIALITGSL